MADLRAEVAVKTKTIMLTEYELCAIEALLSLNTDRNGKKRSRHARDLRSLDDWNGAGRCMRGIGVSTMRKRRSATHAVGHAHALTATATADEAGPIVQLGELGAGDGTRDRNA